MEPALDSRLVVDDPLDEKEWPVGLQPLYPLDGWHTESKGHEVEMNRVYSTNMWQEDQKKKKTVGIAWKAQATLQIE